MLIVFIAYLAAIIGIAIWSAQKSKTNEDFVLGGSKLSGVPLALSERSTGESAWLLLGMTGHALVDGVGAIWIAVGCVAGIFFIWFFMSDKLRVAAKETGALTVPGMLSGKFPGTERSIGLTSALIVVFFFFFYIAAQFSGAGKIFHDAFGMDPIWGMIIGSLVVTVYTMFGGFITVVATDAFQAILMIFTLIVLPIIAVYTIAQYDVDFARSIAAAGDSYISITQGREGWSAAVLVLGGLSWGLGYTGQPQLLARMMAMRSEKDVRAGKWVASFWTIFAYSGAVVIGLAGLSMSQSGLLSAQDSAVIGADSEKIMPVMVAALFNPIMAGVLLSGAVSAMMSTASSQLMVNSSSITEDIYGGLSKSKISQKRLLFLNKTVTLAVGVVAFAIAIFMEDTVYGLVSYAWSGVGSSFGPALVLLLFWKRLSRAGVFASLITGSLGTVIWKTFLVDSTGVTERLASYAAAFVAAVIFSLIFPEKKGLRNGKR